MKLEITLGVKLYIYDKGGELVAVIDNKKKDTPSVEVKEPYRLGADLSGAPTIDMSGSGQDLVGRQYNKD